MSNSTQDTLVDFIKNYYSNISTLFIGWYGGEPLLFLSTIENLTKKLTTALPNVHYSSTIVTNGYLLDRNTAQILNKCHVSMAQVTIDGSKSDHDSRRVPADKTPTYDKIFENISSVIDLLDISIRCNIDKTNAKKAIELLDSIEYWGLKNQVHFYLAPVDNINDSCTSQCCLTIEDFSENESEFITTAVDRGFILDTTPSSNLSICGAVSLNSFVVDPRGRLFKCWSDIGYNERSVGTIFEPPILTPNLINWLSYEPVNPECEKCFAYPVCLGGCPNKRTSPLETRCVSYRYNVLQKLLLENEIYLTKKQLEKC